MLRRTRFIVQVRNFLTSTSRQCDVLRPPLCRVPSFSRPTFSASCASASDHVLPVRADVKMNIQFTCTVCNTRNDKYFSKRAYTSGVVIIRCDGCQNNHLIADHLNWFSHVKGRNIEEILTEKGVKVQRNANGDIELADAKT